MGKKWHPNALCNAFWCQYDSGQIGSYFINPKNYVQPLLWEFNKLRRGANCNSSIRNIDEKENTAEVTMSLYQGAKFNTAPPKTNMTREKTPIWRWISYWKMVDFSFVMLVLGG